eukprot:11908221-Alexandrium_andersonii.AAC.1
MMRSATSHRSATSRDAVLQLQCCAPLCFAVPRVLSGAAPCWTVPSRVEECIVALCCAVLR